MPKRVEVIKNIERAAAAQGLSFTFKRHGAKHDIYDLDGVPIPIGRHRELDNGYANTLYRECQTKLGKDWWR